MDHEQFPAPFECPLARVEEAWIDYNGHMNMAFYNLVFDRALDAAYDALGIGEGYLESSGCSHFTLEAHVCYVREVHLGDPLRITWQLLDWDHKRLHFFEQMHHAEEGWLAATSEQLAIHVDMEARRSAPFSDALQARFAAVMARHGELPTPDRAGRRIAIVRREA
ncbi:MAG: thioesterase family protein [Pseudomonadales bacterium]|jgi:acyl-CoA thioester hydrolase|nr:thioesterase family protein [Pseudomonadales bacterium]